MNGATPTNKITIYVVTTTIAVLSAACVATICLMSYHGSEIGKDLSMITTGLIGALTGMLIKTSPTETQKQSPVVPLQGSSTPVVVVNKPSDPVPTDQVA
jgi:hypothetical protein